MNLTLPTEFLPYLTNSSYVDVLGFTPPWQLDSAWVAQMQERVRQLNSADSSEIREISRYLPNTREAVNLVFMAAAYLPGSSAVFTGPNSDFPWQLVEEFVNPTQRPNNTVLRYTGTYDLWPMFLLDWRISRNANGVARQQSLEVSREIFSWFTEVPFATSRAQVAVELFENILGDPELLKLHTLGPIAEIRRHWQSALPDRFYDAFPEFRGWAETFNWNYQVLSKIHTPLFGPSGPALTEFIARWAKIAKVKTIAPILERYIGREAFDAVQTTFLSDSVSGEAGVNITWQHGFITEALLDGKLELVRIWLGHAQALADIVSGLPGSPKSSGALPLVAFHDDLKRVYTAPKAVNPHLAKLDSLVTDATATNSQLLARPARAEGETDASSDSEEVVAFDLGDPQADLDALIGLKPLKDEIRRIKAEVQVEALRREAGMPENVRAKHLVFTGNPGTAKTTVARILARMYAQLGVLRRGHLIEASRQDLVGEYIGQTAPKVKEITQLAMGGVLFIDEAYALTPKDSPRDFGQEAVATLIKIMEDHRDDLIVIVAGYPDEMKYFLETNPGTASRFPRTLNFPDYNDKELWQIFCMIATSAGFTWDKNLERAFRKLCPGRRRPRTFGNGRWVRNVFEEATSRQASRIISLAHTPTHEEIRALTTADLPANLDEVPSVHQNHTGMYL